MKNPNLQNVEPVFKLNPRKIFMSVQKARKDEEIMLETIKKHENKFDHKTFQIRTRKNPKNDFFKNYIAKLNNGPSPVQLMQVTESLQEESMIMRQARQFVTLPQIPSSEKLISIQKELAETLAHPPFRNQLPDEDLFERARGLSKFDCWKHDQTPEEWLAYCKQTPDQPHAKVPYFKDGHYIWVEARVLDYDGSRRRFQVDLGEEARPRTKWVDRLSIYFLSESADRFRERVAQCRRFQKKAEDGHRLSRVIEAVNLELVQVMPPTLINTVLKSVSKSKRLSTLVPAEQSLLSGLIMTVRSDYLQTMKKAVVLREGHPLLENEISTPKIQETQCITQTESLSFEEKFSALKKAHLVNNKSVREALQFFQEKCFAYCKTSIFAFKEGECRGPFTLETFLEAQASSFKTARDYIKTQWREYPFRDIYEMLKDMPQFCFDPHEVKEPTQTRKSATTSLMRRIDAAFRQHLRTLLRTNVENYVNYLRSFVAEGQEEIRTVLQRPLLKIKLKLPEVRKKKGRREENIVFSPSISELNEKLCEPLLELARFVAGIDAFESDFRSTGSPELKVFPAAGEEPALIAAPKRIEVALATGFAEARSILARFSPFEYLMERPAEEIAKAQWEEWKQGGANGTDLYNLLERETRNIRELGTLCGRETSFLMFEVDCEEVRRSLAERASEVVRGLLKRLSSQVQKGVSRIKEKYAETQRALTTVPETEEALVALTKALREHDGLVSALETETTEVGRLIELMNSFGEKLEEEQMVSFWLLKVCPLELKNAVREGRRLEERSDSEFKLRLENERRTFEAEVESLRTEVARVVLFDNFAEIDSCAMAAEKLGRRIDAAVERVADFNRREKLFGLPTAPYYELEAVVRSFADYRRMWSVAYALESSRQNWHTSPLPKLSFRQLSNDVDQFRRELRELADAFEGVTAPSAVVNQMRRELAAVEGHLPLLEALLKDCMKKPNNWRGLFSALGLRVPAQTESLRGLVTIGLPERLEAIEEFVGRADREFALETKLSKDILEKLKVTKVELIPHAATESSLLGNADALAQLIDDHLSTLLAMKQSPFLGGLRKKVEEVERKLVGMQDFFVEWVRCQRAWLYLQPIFGAEDLKKSMSSEKKQFDGVDRVWRAIVTTVANEPYVFEHFDWEKHKPDMEANNKTLEGIQKQLAKYMEAKREEFPRFYFLADEELLELLATTKEPSGVRKFLSKCFEGIDDLEFGTSGELRAVLSAQRERVELGRPVDPSAGEKKGCVEKWLCELEDSSRETLRALCRSAMEGGKTVEDWLEKYPAQVTLAANAVCWAHGVESALEKDGLKAFTEERSIGLSKVVARVRADLPQLERVTIAAFITLEVHALHVLEELVRRGVSDNHDFSWTSQLRYYYLPAKGQMRVKAMTAEYEYQYEYIGNTPRLVLTPLTDRCYRTLLCAFQFFYGGAPEGPAGTGKTETVKDLAKAVAVQCVVFNCTDHINHAAMSKFFKGLAQCGAWACFDEFNRIAPEVLSVVAEQVRAIQSALKEGKLKFGFEGQNIKLAKSCAVNITMNPGYAGRAELPDNLKALFRSCAMMVPDYSLIAEISLYSSGFEGAGKLAAKVVGALRLASEQLSSQKHYDFGMRALKAILVAAASLKRVDSVSDEAKLVLQALLDVNLPKFTVEDISLFEAIVADLFPAVSAPEKDWASLNSALQAVAFESKLTAGPNFISKAVQLWETVQVRHGLMLVGPACSGKTACLNTLKNALRKIGISADSIALNPKSITGLQLYGALDPNTQGWTDGVLPSVMKASLEEMLPGDRRWIVFDGPVDAGWIENINTLLDDNKILCLTNGQKIRMVDGMTVMFEVEDLIAASPATVSRCGMVFVDEEVLGVGASISRFSTFELPQKLSHLSSAFESSLTDLLHGVLTIARSQKKLPMKLTERALAENTLKLLSVTIAQWDGTGGESWAKEAVWFSIVWGICVLLADEQKAQALSWLVGRRTEPLKASPLSLRLDMAKQSWLLWGEGDAHLPPSRDGELFVATPDSLRNEYFLRGALECGRHSLMVGPTGTGKSVQLMAETERWTSREWAVLQMNFSAQTSANGLQRAFEARICSRRGRKGHFGPEEGRPGVAAFLDDLSMPAREPAGAQPPLEFLRQWLDTGYWFELETREKRYSSGLMLATAMASPESGIPVPSARILRHFLILHAPQFGKDSLTTIFSTRLETHFSGGLFLGSVVGMRPAIVKASVELFSLVRGCKALLPTPAKSHYVFSLRDVARVFTGLEKSSARSLGGSEDVIKLWAHESLRVYADRLAEPADASLFKALLAEAAKVGFDRELKRVIKKEPLLFGSFGSNGRAYAEYADLGELRTACERGLEALSETRGEKLPLVLFEAALEHAARLARIFSTYSGHALAVGLAGLGRRSLSLLATQLCNFVCLEPELKSGYGLREWGEDLVRVLHSAGIDRKGTVFLVRDAALPNESALEDLSGLLARGETPAWLPTEEKARLLEDAASALALDESLGLAARVDALRRSVRKNLHICLLMSPVDARFRKRLRAFPALINCTTIDWFSEWPAAALGEVARGVISELLPTNPAHLPFHAAAHLAAASAARKFFNERRRQLFITPAAFLTALSAFKKVYATRGEQLNAALTRYETGSATLATARADVESLKKAIRELEPKLAISEAETNGLILRVSEERAEADAAAGVCAGEEAAAIKEREAAAALKEACAADLAKVEPQLEEALKELRSIRREHIDFIKSLKSPVPPILRLFHALCVLFKVKGAPPIRDPSAPGGKRTDWATPARNVVMAKPDQMLTALMDFDANAIDALSSSLIDSLREICADPSFDLTKMAKVSEAASKIAFFVVKVVEIWDQLQVINPKRQALATAITSLEATEARLAAKKSELAGLIALVEDRETQLKAAQKKAEDLRSEIEKCSRQSNAAEKLLAGLESERLAWTKNVRDLREESEASLGDSLISSYALAYFGGFPADYREQLLSQWKTALHEAGVRYSDGFSIATLLADELEVGGWVSRLRLPNDSHSVENAVIATRAPLPPFCLDPQAQANRWLRLLEKDAGLVLLRPSMRSVDLEGFLSNAVEAGQPVLFENLPETPDRVLIELIEAPKRVKNGKQQVKYSGRWLTQHAGFRLYLTTKLARPALSPEFAIRVTLLDFAATPAGLEDQLLNTIVSREDPNSEKARQNNVREYYELKRKQKATEEHILALLAGSVGGNLLDDAGLIEALGKSKQESKDAQMRLADTEAMKKKLGATRNTFKRAAVRASQLFFCLTDLSSAEPMYQFSLDWFFDLFCAAINKEPKVRETRAADIAECFTRLLFTKASLSLFEKDKLLFSFLVYLRATLGDDLTIARPLLLAGSKTIPDHPNPVPSVFSDKQWAGMEDAGRTQAGIRAAISTLKAKAAEWTAFITSPTPEALNPPAQLTELEHLVLMRVLRPDRLLALAQRKIEACLGRDFVDYPPISLETAFSDSKNTTPIIFILSPGADPLADIFRLANSLSKKANIDVLALGQGQEEAAQAALSNAKEKGRWVVLQNAHLAPGFLSRADRILEEPNLSVDFRLWITSMPTDQFPVTLLQSGLKITCEPPGGVRANVLRTLASISPKYFEVHTRAPEWKRLYFGLIFFHAVAQERRRFGALGWNIPYEFSAADLTISSAQLHSLLKESDEVPWEALKYAIAEANYGGRVTDPMDRRLLSTMLETFVSPEALSTEHRYCELEVYAAPEEGNFLQVRAAVQAYPSQDPPELFGLHPNAEITSSINKANSLMSSALSLLPRVFSVNGKSSDEVLKEMAAELRAKLPPLFNVEKIKSEHPISYADSMNTVLIQELGRFNILIEKIGESLFQLIKAIEGVVIMTDELDEVYLKLFNNQVPEAWSSVAYPSLKPLSSWFNNFLDRLAFMRKWVEQGPPEVFWLSGFFFTQSFLTGTLQDYARKTKKPIDQITFKCEMVEESAAKLTRPPIGAYVNGLYLEGAAWSSQLHCLVESKPNELYAEVPVLWLKPIAIDDLPLAHEYKCPVYKTSKRAGVLSTTGHSTNFVISVGLPLARGQSEGFWVKRGVAMICELDD